MIYILYSLWYDDAKLSCIRWWCTFISCDVSIVTVIICWCRRRWRPLRLVMVWGRRRRQRTSFDRHHSTGAKLIEVAMRRILTVDDDHHRGHEDVEDTQPPMEAAGGRWRTSTDCRSTRSCWSTTPQPSTYRHCRLKKFMKNKEIVLLLQREPQNCRRSI